MTLLNNNLENIPAVPYTLLKREESNANITMQIWHSRCHLIEENEINFHRSELLRFMIEIVRKLRNILKGRRCMD